jgi:hypothetical protein
LGRGIVLGSAVLAVVFIIAEAAAAAADDDDDDAMTKLSHPGDGFLRSSMPCAKWHRSLNVHAPILNLVQSLVL